MEKKAHIDDLAKRIEKLQAGFAIERLLHKDDTFDIKVRLLESYLEIVKLAHEPSIP